MSSLAVLTVAAFSLTVQSFEPATLQTGTVKPVDMMTAAAGMVITELTVDARGSVQQARAIQSLSPFTNLVRDSVMTWRFDAARANRVRTESRVLIIGLFRPPALLFPVPEVPNAPSAKPAEDVPFPSSLAVPPYPPNAMGSASVVVEAQVGDDGSVSSTRTVGETTGFDSAAADAVAKWKFEPAKRDGSGVRAVVYFIVSFRQPLN